MYRRKVDVDMLNAVKSVVVDVSSVSPSSEQGELQPLAALTKHIVYFQNSLHLGQQL